MILHIFSQFNEPVIKSVRALLWITINIFHVIAMLMDSMSKIQLNASILRDYYKFSQLKKVLLVIQYKEWFRNTVVEKPKWFTIINCNINTLKFYRFENIINWFIILLWLVQMIKNMVILIIICLFIKNSSAIEFPFSTNRMFSYVGKLYPI